jgi:hypothetical protein
LAAARALAEIPDPRAEAALTSAIRAGDPEVAAAAYRFLLRKGRPGSESLLVRSLETYGRISMAEEFASSGNPVLQAAAKEWARKQDAVLTRPAHAAGDLRWGQQPGARAPLALFHFDDSFATASGIPPTQADKALLVAGRWGSALSIESGGILSYPQEDNLDFRRGTIEMWVATRFDGNHPIYAKYNHALLLYLSPAAEQFLLSEGSWLGFYGGSVIDGRLEGAGGGNISGWKAGEWHYVAFAFSAERGQRLYLDGVLVSERQEPMRAPQPGGRFTVASDPYGNWSAFIVDELRISSDDKSADEIRYNAGRKRPFEEYERFRPLDPGL